MEPRSIGSVGDSAPHDNVQPYLSVAFYMNTKGLFPSRG
jgi:microcystin-dependent protein